MARWSYLLAFAWLAGCSAVPGHRAEDRALQQGAVLGSVCSGCHAPGGSAIVSLAGYSPERLEALVTAYRGDGDTVMHRMARGYTDAEIESIAAHLGSR